MQQNFNSQAVFVNIGVRLGLAAIEVVKGMILTRLFFSKSALQVCFAHDSVNAVLVI